MGIGGVKIELVWRKTGQGRIELMFIGHLSIESIWELELVSPNK